MMSRDKPYPTEDDPKRHNPSHFCEPIGGRVSCPEDKCGFCNDDCNDEVDE